MADADLSTSYAGDVGRAVVINRFQAFPQANVDRSYITTTTQPITRYQRQLKTAAANEWPR
jgi:hypothetical protein